MTHDTATISAVAHVGGIVRRSGSSFYWSMRLLPRRRREAIYALYAFCREVDDVADGPGDTADKLQNLRAWRQAIDALYEGAPDRPTTRALLPAVRAYDLPKAEFEAIIDGMEIDATQDLVAPSQAELQSYCRKVAGAVGRLAVRIFGDGSTAASQLADLQGEALQYTNILRDVTEDAARGRLYLPRELLEAAGVPLDPAAALQHPGLADACAAMARQAHERFVASEALLTRCERRCRRPCRVMLQLYGRLLDRLVARGWRQPAPRLRLGAAEKLGIVLRYGLI